MRIKRSRSRPLSIYSFDYRPSAVSYNIILRTLLHPSALRKGVSLPMLPSKSSLGRFSGHWFEPLQLVLSQVRSFREPCRVSLRYRCFFAPLCPFSS